MKKSWLLSLLLLVPLSGEAQESSGVGIGMARDHFPVFRLHEGHFPGSSAYTLALSYYDPDFAQAEFKLHHTRGYDPSISYSYGFSAAWVAPLSEELLFKAGLGLDGYKLKDRKCKSFLVSLLKAFSILGDVCQEDDIHASFNPFAAIEWRVAEPLSVSVRMSHRMMISSTDYVKETITRTTSNGEKYQYNIIGTENSVYGAGFGFGIGLTFYLY